MRLQSWRGVYCLSSWAYINAMHLMDANNNVFLGLIPIRIVLEMKREYKNMK